MAVSERGVTPLPAPLRRAGERNHRWRIVAENDGVPRTDLHRHIMYVPTGDSDQDLGTRTHEMLHAAYTPRDIGEDSGIDPQMINAAEDARIETLATSRGIERPASVAPEKLFHALVNAAAKDMLPAMALASVGSPSEVAVRRELTTMGIPAAQVALDVMDNAGEMFRDDMTPEATLRVADMLARAMGHSTGADGTGQAGQPATGTHGAPVPGSPPPSGTSSPGKPAGKPTAPRAPWPAPFGKPSPRPAEPTGTAGKDKPSPHAPSDQENLDAGVVPVPDLRKMANLTDGGYDGYGWAVPTIKTPRRPVKLAEAGHARHGPSDEGTVPVLWHRLPVDQRVFRARRHTRRGTVLIDMSGSMGLTRDDVETMIKTVPASVIAGYWGNGDHGTIIVLAASGHRVSDADLAAHGFENAVDGPALMWLTRQRAPRVWVSDGQITGADDGPVTHAMRDQVNAMLRRARITQVNPNQEHATGWVKAVLMHI